MTPDTQVTIILDESLMRARPSLMELEALAGKAVALLACKAELVSATIFRKPGQRPQGRRAGDGPQAASHRPQASSYWISVSDSKRNMRGLYELKPQQPVVDFEVVNKVASDLVV